MSSKVLLTEAEITLDIVNVLKRPERMSKATYKKLDIVGMVLAYPMAVIAILLYTRNVYDYAYAWFILVFAVLMLGWKLFKWLRRKNRVKSVSISDYRISTETVHSIDEEHYYTKSGGKGCFMIAVDNYWLRFENCKEWVIPKDNYAWSVERRMSDLEIFQSTHRGDTMIVVTHAETNEIVMAYCTDIFTYKNEGN